MIMKDAVPGVKISLNLDHLASWDHRVIQARMVLSINLGFRIVTFKNEAC